MRPPVRTKLGVGIAVVILAACGGARDRVTTAPTSSLATSSVATTTTDAASPSIGGLRAAAIHYAQAWLAADFGAVLNTHDPGCMGTLTTAPGSDPAPPSDKDWATVAPALNAALRATLGIAPSLIKVTGVRVRNMTATTGEAEVEYNQPISVTGDDNWVRYALEDGSWKNDCKLPIGGGSRTQGTPGMQGPRPRAVAAP